VLAGRGGVRYTELTVFKHLDPTRGHPSPIALARELVRFARAIYPLFRWAAWPKEQVDRDRELAGQSPKTRQRRGRGPRERRMRR
jgi:hypothetical protein